MFLGDSRVVVLNYSDSETHLMKSSNLQVMNEVVSGWMAVVLAQWTVCLLTNLAFYGGGHSNNPQANWKKNSWICGPAYHF